MTIREHIRFHYHSFTNNTLDRESPAINFRRHPLDYDTASSVLSLLLHARKLPVAKWIWPTAAK